MYIHICALYPWHVARESLPIDFGYPLPTGKTLQCAWHVLLPILRPSFFISPDGIGGGVVYEILMEMFERI